jgi:ubiquinone/menaquinone biosynthesis C-methylase UbiE
MATELFWDRIAPKYARKPVDDPDAYEEKLALVVSLLKPGDRVLEIGCGTGHHRTAPRAQRRPLHCHRRSASAMIGIAEAKLGADAPANVTFRHADAAEQVAVAPLDAVCAFSLLHLVEDIPAVLAAVRAQLEAGWSVPVQNGVHPKAAAWPIRLR